MIVPRYVRVAAEAIDAWFFAPRRLRKWQQEHGIDILSTKIAIKRARHQPVKREQQRLQGIVHAALESEVRHDAQIS